MILKKIKSLHYLAVANAGSIEQLKYQRTLKEFKKNYSIVWNPLNYDGTSEIDTQLIMDKLDTIISNHEALGLTPLKELKTLKELRCV